jgi:GntR family transcriptional regulator
MSISIQIQPGDDIPIYRQIVRQIQGALARAELKPGDRLESHRELAARLVVAPLTVKKAYDELERDGYLEMRRGRGTFVRQGLSDDARDVRSQALRDSIAQCVHEALSAGIALEALVELVRELGAAVPTSKPQSPKPQLPQLDEPENE